MKKCILIATVFSLILLTPTAASMPEIEHAMFYQQKLTGGEDIVLGTQFNDKSSDVTRAVATLRNGGRLVDSDELLDRQGDDFFSGRLGPVDGGKTYRVEIEGWNSEGERVSESYTRRSHCNIGLFGSCLN